MAILGDFIYDHTTPMAQSGVDMYIVIW